MKIEYRVRPVTRYVVTRYHETDEGRTGGSETKGEYDNFDVAYEVGYALCKAEHEALGYPPDDMRVQYPRRIDATSATTGAALGALAQVDLAQREYNTAMSRQMLFGTAGTD